METVIRTYQGIEKKWNQLRIAKGQVAIMIHFNKQEEPNIQWWRKPSIPLRQAELKVWGLQCLAIQMKTRMAVKHQFHKDHQFPKWDGYRRSKISKVHM